MKEQLRKVAFNLNEQGAAIEDFEKDCVTDVFANRQGLFHRWGDVIVYDPQQERNLQKTVAIVEEIDTGKVYEVAPRLLTFKK